MAPPVADDEHQPILQMTGIRKSFPGVLAVDSASFELQRGEIHALVGANGAGKSTLIKILTGVHRADTGEVAVNGQTVTIHSPSAAQRLGIAAIYQELTLVPGLTVSANLFLGHERTRASFIDSAFERRMAIAQFEKLGVKINPDSLVKDLTVAERQLVEIARALLAEARMLVMDEPTAALAPYEVETLFGILRDLVGRHVGIIFISHRLDEILAIADRVTIMRDGMTISCCRVAELTRQRLIEQMVGRSLKEEFPKAPPPSDKTGFEVRHLSGGMIRDASFSAKRGEVLGLAGLMGAGRTELARLIFGADQKDRGEIALDGHPVEVRSPREAIRHGICLLTEDRKSQGLVLKASAKDNFALPNLSAWSHLGWINKPRESTRFLEHVENLSIRVAGPDQKAEDLSGGNQQKLLVARWLETKSQVIIFDEPTRGIDVGAKYEMYLLIRDLAAQGKIVIMISSELPEVLGISHRVLVMRDGEITGELDPSSATQHDIMALAG